MTTDMGIFSRLANSSARYFGSATAFGIALGMVLMWAIAGPVFEFSDSWELVINTPQSLPFSWCF